MTEGHSLAVSELFQMMYNEIKQVWTLSKHLTHSSLTGATVLHT